MVATPLHVNRAPDAPSVPASYGQERLLFLEHLTNGHPFYNSPFMLRVRGPLDTVRLRAALDHVVERQAVLRTTIHVGKDTAVQSIHDDVHVELTESRWPDARSDELCDEEMADLVERCRRRVRLGSLPALTAHLFHRGDHDHVLHLQMHHVVTDAWSASVMGRDLTAAYDGRPPAPAPVPFTEFSVEQRDAEGTGTWQAQRDFWLQHLDGLDPVITVPGDHERPPIARHDGAVAETVVEGSLVSRVQALTSALRVLPMSVYVVAWGRTIEALSGRSDMVFASPFANRQPKYARTAGFFTNQLPIRLTFDRAVDGSFVRDVSASLLSMQRHESYPFEQIVRDLDLRPDLSLSPLVQLGFTFSHSGTVGTSIRFGDATATPILLDYGTSRIDLYLAVHQDDSALSCVMWYDTALYGPSSADAIVARYVRTLHDLVTSLEEGVASS